MTRLSIPLICGLAALAALPGCQRRPPSAHLLDHSRDDGRPREWTRRDAPLDHRDPSDIVDWKASGGPIIGMRWGKDYVVHASLGIVRTNQQEGETQSWERWTIDCSFEAVETPGCFLERLTLGSSGSDTTTAVSVDRFSTADGSIHDLALDTKSGSLKLSLSSRTGTPDNQTALVHVSIGFRMADGLLHLTSFDAIGRERDSRMERNGEPILMSVRYCVAEYTVSLQAPFTLQGMSSPEVRAWREMEATLSVGDRRVWSDLAKYRREFMPNEWQLARRDAGLAQAGMAETTLPTKANEDVHTIYAEAFLARFRDRLARSPMSRDGQEKILRHLRVALQP